jgi:hypothetical protein
LIGMLERGRSLLPYALYRTALALAVLSRRPPQPVVRVPGPATPAASRVAAAVQ